MRRSIRLIRLDDAHQTPSFNLVCSHFAFFVPIIPRVTRGHRIKSYYPRRVSSSPSSFDLCFLFFRFPLRLEIHSDLVTAVTDFFRISPIRVAWLLICEIHRFFFFFFIYAIEPSTGFLLAACTSLCVPTVQKQFCKLLYKDIQLRYMFPIYILITRAVKSLSNTAKHSTQIHHRCQPWFLRNLWIINGGVVEITHST